LLINEPHQPAEEDQLTVAPDARDARRKTKARIKAPPPKPVELDKKDKKEKDQWLLVQGALQDAQGVRDAIGSLEWSEGLGQRTVDTVENLLKRAAGLLYIQLLSF